MKIIESVVNNDCAYDKCLLTLTLEATREEIIQFRQMEESDLSPLIFDS